jgi:hypothetical protein
MTNYPVRIRIGSENAGDPETRTYTDSTFAEAVAALQGTHAEPISAGYHRRETVYVVATYAEDHDEYHGPKRSIARRAGEPVFGASATIYGRDLKFGGQGDAEVSWASGGSMSPEAAELMLTIYRLATEIARAANAEPFCPACQPELARYAERAARLAAGE